MNKLYIYYKTFFYNRKKTLEDRKTLPLILVLQKFSDITHPTQNQPRNLLILEVATLVTANWKLDLITSDQVN